MYRYCKSIVLTGTFILATSFSAYSAEFVSIVKDGVNVRTGPSTDNPIYMELFQGYPLKVTDKKDDWLKVQDYENDSGWVYSSLVEAANTVIVTAQSKANMRSGPGTQNPIVASIERGVVLSVLDRKDKWVNVKHVSGTEGWIYSPLVWP